MRFPFLAGRSLFEKATAVMLAVAISSAAGAADAETLSVGPNQSFKMPSEAAAVAKPGDTISIEPGEYFDCAVWKADNLTIEGKGPGVIITDKVCQGKGLFITTGANITVRNLTLTRAVVVDGNGAGIRAEGANLKVENVQFIRDQDGILAGENKKSTITIDRSTFTDDGSCANGGGCAHGLYVGQIALLRVTNSDFSNTHDGHHIKSRAARTEIIGNKITDGPKGTSSYLIDIPNGGSLLVERNTMEKGPKTSNSSAAIEIGAEGVNQRTEEITIKDNKFTNDMGRSVNFMWNLTATSAILSGNTFTGEVNPLKGDGEVN